MICLTRLTPAEKGSTWFKASLFAMPQTSQNHAFDAQHQREEPFGPVFSGTPYGARKLAETDPIFGPLGRRPSLIQWFLTLDLVCTRMKNASFHVQKAYVPLQARPKKMRVARDGGHSYNLIMVGMVTDLQTALAVGGEDVYRS